jgi:hypothetical protein
LWVAELLPGKEEAGHEREPGRAQQELCPRNPVECRAPDPPGQRQRGESERDPEPDPRALRVLVRERRRAESSRGKERDEYPRPRGPLGVQMAMTTATWAAGAEIPVYSIPMNRLQGRRNTRSNPLARITAATAEGERRCPSSARRSTKAANSTATTAPSPI